MLQKILRFVQVANQIIDQDINQIPQEQGAVILYERAAITLREVHQLEAVIILEVVARHRQEAHQEVEVHHQKVLQKEAVKI